MTGISPSGLPWRSPFAAVALATLAALAGSPLTATRAQAPAGPAGETITGTLQPVIVTGAAPDRQRWVAPASIDVIEGDEIRNGQLQVNLSESLGRVPGLFIQNRQNYAQDLQLSIRGFGARSTFGVRGLRLYVDGIPASSPDGQGQTSNFPLGNAERIEIIRGPYSALYGASSGGVIALTTADGQSPTTVRAGLAAGADGLWRASSQALGRVGEWGYALDVSAFSTDGARPQSAADRQSGNLKLSRRYGEGDTAGRIVLLAGHQSLSAQDPLGLSRPEFDANPRQTTASALLFNTRKDVDQSQLGLAWQQGLGGGHQLEFMAYGGQRQTTQFQSIPVATQAPAAYPGGVIDLDRSYGGWNARWRFDRREGTGEDARRFTISAGLAADGQREVRRGYQNFIGPPSSPAALGVLGVLRRDEVNRASTVDPYVQAEWATAAWTWTAGLRHSRVRFRSADHYTVPGNPDDSGATGYSGTSPVAGVRWRLAPTLQAFASIGRGFETPTLNEAAYSAAGSAGLNTALGASRSRSAEAGLRGRHGTAAWTATLFDIRTRNEIVVLANTGGRTTYQNAGATRRRGLELAGDTQWRAFTLTSALTWMQAQYTDGFLSGGQPVTAGNRMPGVPRAQAYVQLAWGPGWAGSTLSAELRHTGRLAVDDRNTDFAPGATLLGLAARFRQDRGDWSLREFVRIDNAANRRYAGSVIVNEGNGRFFEPGQRRSVYAGIEIERRFR
jgi:iron complex outermembrane receptor protein